VTRGALAVMLIAVAAASAPVHAQHRYEQVEFGALLGAHINAELGADNLSEVTGGAPVETTCVYVTATRARVTVFGAPAVALTNGVIPASAIAPCASGATCVPRLRDAIATARGALAAGRNGERAPILVIADRSIPYSTLLLIARSAAEAGASLSIRLAARRGRALVWLPVWVAPGRTITLSPAGNPAILSVTLDRGVMAVTTTRHYLARPAFARGMAELLHELSQVQLTSGRTTMFLTASATTSTGDVLAVLAAVRTVFPNVVLRGLDERPVVER
jgi:hypothetical protein